MTRQFIYASLFMCTLFSASAAMSTTLSPNQKQLQQTVEENVYLGWSGVHAQEILANLKPQTPIKQLTAGSITSLKWATQKSTPVNAGSKNNPLFICRAAVPHVLGSETAHYPGQLIDNHCQITQPKGVGIADDYAVLTGNPAVLKWVPIKEMMDTMRTKLHAKANTSQFPYGFSMESFDFDIHLQGYMAISGGDEGGNPVLICRSGAHSSATVGKLIFIGNNLGCNIIKNGKAHTEMAQYAILFAKQ